MAEKAAKKNTKTANNTTKKQKKLKKRRATNRPKSGMMQTIAKERIEQLFNEAEMIAKSNPERAKRYITLARKVGMKAKVSIPSRLKRKYCKNCLHFLIPGHNCRVRNNRGMMVYYCLECKHLNKVGIKKKVKKKENKEKRK